MPRSTFVDSSNAPPIYEGQMSRKITRRRLLQAGAGSSFTVLWLANGNKIVAQNSTPAAPAMDYKEAPSLAELVANGSLPPVAERLPENPIVVEPVERIGTYGGNLRSALLGGSNTGMLDRIVGYEQMLRWAPDWSEVVPNVASGYEVSADSRTFTFSLRPGMKWSDGAPFSADDILFYINDVSLNEKLGGPGANPFTGEKIDDFTLTITFENPFGLFPQNLCYNSNQWTNYPKHYLSQFHEAYNTENLDALIAENKADDWVNLFRLKGGSIPGTPYNAMWWNPELPRLHGWKMILPYADGGRVTFERNPYYWKVDPEGNQLPYIDGMTFDALDDAEVLLLKTMSGEIDMIQRSICTLANKPVLSDAQESGGYNLFEAVPSIMNTNVYQLNQSHKDLAIRDVFNNKDFRIGLSYAINRQEVIDAVYVSQGEPWQAAPRPESPLYSETMAKQFTEYDVDLANESLDKVLPEKDGDGFRLRPDGQRLTFVMEVQTGGEFPEMVDAANLVVGYWREVGVDAILKSEDGSLFNSRITANDHDAAVWPGGSGLQDMLLNPYMYMPYAYSFFGKGWYYWWKPPTSGGSEPVEPPEPVKQQFALYDQVSETTDEAEQARLLGEILKIAETEFFNIGIGLPAVVYGVRKNNLKNVPDSMPEAAVYPTPGPTNTCQYFLEM
jgi:peptide/nickel transport system substrate-binding protein